MRDDQEWIEVEDEPVPRRSGLAAPFVLALTALAFAVGFGAGAWTLGLESAEPPVVASPPSLPAPTSAPIAPVLASAAPDARAEVVIAPPPAKPSSKPKPKPKAAPLPAPVVADAPPTISATPPTDPIPAAIAEPAVPQRRPPPSAKVRRSVPPAAEPADLGGPGLDQ